MLNEEEKSLLRAFEELLNIGLELIAEQGFCVDPEDHGFTLGYQIDEDIITELDFFWEDGRYIIFFRDFGEIYMECEDIDQVLYFFLDYVRNYRSWEAIFRNLNQECAAQEMVPFGQSIDPMILN